MQRLKRYGCQTKADPAEVREVANGIWSDAELIQ